MKTLKVISFLLALTVPSFVCNAYWVWSPELGKFVNPEGESQDISEESFGYANQLYKDKKLDDAIEQLDDLLKKYGNSQIAPEAQYLKGVIYEEKREYYKAFESYKKLQENYPHGTRQEEVIEREFRIGNLFLSGRKAKLMGLEILPSLPRAVEVFESIVQNAPYSAFGYQSQFRLGVAYQKSGKFAEAMEAFQSVIDNYPQSDLVTEARYQLAETAFSRSNVQARDERALESASEHVDRFLMRYPDANVSEKAAKLRQEIDEKNAERNYRIAVYYEKDKFLSSALLYYRDVAKRYPHTQWGAKAKEKLASLQEPVAYISDKEEKIESEIQLLRAKLDDPDTGKVDKESLKRQLERLSERSKLLDKSKTESLNSREDDIKRREEELKQKTITLAEKKERYKDNTSEDFRRAMERWELSLEDERQRLADEKDQLTAWKESLGMPVHDPVWNLVPFMNGKEDELEKIRHIGTKQLYKVSDEKRSLLAEKEILYKQHYQVSELLSRQTNYTPAGAGVDQAYLLSGAGFEERQEQLKAVKDEIEYLEEQLELKNKAYQERFGEAAWKRIISAPVRVITVPGAVMGSALKGLNPFRGNDVPLDELGMDELMEAKMHLKEKVAAQRALVDILSQAFDEQLAVQEQKNLLASLENKTDVDVRQLRKDIKATEKEIRAAYTEIGDRYEDIKKISGELELVLKQREHSSGAARTSAIMSAPGKTVARAAKDFFFGRKPAEVVLSEEAKRIDATDALAQEAKRLQEDIELNSMVMEARNREIYQLQKKLDILQTRASLAGGYKFRSAMVEVPYAFLDDAIDSARDLLPKKDRKEEMLRRLDKETQDLEQYKMDLKKTEDAIILKQNREAEELKAAAELDPRSAAARKFRQMTAKAAPANMPAAEEAVTGDETHEKEMLEKEIETVANRLSEKRQVLELNSASLENEQKAVKREIKVMQKSVDSADDEKNQKVTEKHEKKLEKELSDLEEELVKLVLRESELEEKETDILENRINKIDQLVQRIHSKAVAQDLLTERNRMEERLSQIDMRRNFLNNELERFQPAKAKVA